MSVRPFLSIDFSLMLQQALAATLNILLFRAGPQDFPFGPRLAPWVVAPAIVIYTLFFSQLFDTPMALVVSLIAVAGISLQVRVVLKLRRLPNRVPQTTQALIATMSMLTLALLFPFAQIAPQLIALAQLPPEVLQQSPPQLELPAAAAITINLLSIWRFAVAANVYRHAADVSLAMGALIALLCELSLPLLMMFGIPLAAAITGGGIRAG